MIERNKATSKILLGKPIQYLRSSVLKSWNSSTLLAHVVTTEDFQEELHIKQRNHLEVRLTQGIAAASLVVVSAFGALAPAGIANAAGPVATHVTKRKVYIAHVNIQAWSAKNMHRKILPHGEWTVDTGRRKTWHGWHLALINTDYSLCWIGAPYIGL